MFENGKCVACGFPAGAACTMCGVKSSVLRTSKGSWAILALASKRISRDARDELAREVMEIELVIAARSWLRGSLGELAEFLRKRRPKTATTPTSYEKRVTVMGSKDRFLLDELDELDVDGGRAAIERYDVLAAEALNQGFVSTLGDADAFVRSQREPRIMTGSDSDPRRTPTLPDVLAPPPPPSVAADVSNVALIQELMKRSGLTAADLAAPAISTTPAQES